MHHNNFQVIRLFAALQVAFMHSLGHLGVQSTFLNTAASILKYIPGVPIFFVISGFLVYKSLARLDYKLVPYFKNRALRIFPALFPAALLVLLLLVIFQEGPLLAFLSQFKLWIWFIGQVTFFQFYTPDILRFWACGTPNGSLWTISVELQFYILLPIITFFVRRFKTVKFIFLFLILASIGANYMLKELYFEDQFIGKLLGVSFIPYLYFFLFGTITAVYWDRLKPLFIDQALVWGVLFASVCIFLELNPAFQNILSYWYLSLYKLGFDLLLAGFVISFAFSSPSITKKFNPLNDYSYGIYIYHMIVINTFLSLKLTSHIWFYCILLLTIILAVLSWHLVEKQALKLKTLS